MVYSRRRSNLKSIWKHSFEKHIRRKPRRSRLPCFRMDEKEFESGIHARPNSSLKSPSMYPFPSSPCAFPQVIQIRVWEALSARPCSRIRSRAQRQCIFEVIWTKETHLASTFVKITVLCQRNLICHSETKAWLLVFSIHLVYQWQAIRHVFSGFQVRNIDRKARSSPHVYRLGLMGLDLRALRRKMSCTSTNYAKAQKCRPISECSPFWMNTLIRHWR